MLSSFRNLVLISAALTTTAAFAAEQRKVEVPFTFVAKNHVYQAGSYTISVDWAKSMVTLSQVGKPSQPLMWIMVPAANGGQPKVSLIFDVEGPNHVLRTIQYERFATPNLDTQRKPRVESATTIGE